jgi:hypothetical protein
VTARFGICLVALVGASLANAAPNLNGLWQTVDPPQALRVLNGELPPMLPAARKLYEQHLAARQRSDLSFDNTERCQPPGLPRIYLEHMPFEIQQQDDAIYVLFEWNRLFRVIEMHTSHDHQNIYGPTFLGFAVGHWDEAALVIDTVGFNDATLLDSAGLPHSEDLHVTERWKLQRNGQRIDALVTVEDASTFGAPWQFRMQFRKLPPSATIHEDVCLERQRPVVGPSPAHPSTG